MKILKVSHPWNHINQDFSKHLHAALSFSTFSTKQFPRRATLQSITYLNLNTKFSFIIPPLSSAVALLVLSLCGLAVREFSFALRAAGPKISKCTCYKCTVVFVFFCTSAGRSRITLSLSPLNGKVTLTRLRSGNL